MFLFYVGKMDSQLRDPSKYTVNVRPVSTISDFFLPGHAARPQFPASSVVRGCVTGLCTEMWAHALLLCNFTTALCSHLLANGKEAS